MKRTLHWRDGNETTITLGFGNNPEGPFEPCPVDGSVTLRLPLPNGIIGETVEGPSWDHTGWLTVTKAARRYIEEMKPTIITLKRARELISKACYKGRLKHEGRRHQRRIDPDSLDAFILAKRNEHLEKDERRERKQQEDPPPIAPIINRPGSRPDQQLRDAIEAENQRILTAKRR